MIVFGPIPSRRLGRSLGVNNIPPKICTYSCVYCQLGRTRTLTTERQSFFKKENIYSDIEKVIRANEGKIDYITFVGDGEPTLNSDLGELIRMCKSNFPYKTAVITNGSLLWKEDLRRDIAEADVVNITMSAGDNETFKCLHRPHGRLSFSVILDGVRAFAREYGGEIWAEIMLVDTINDATDKLKALKSFIDEVKPAKSFVMTPTRPPAELWVRKPKTEKIIEALAIFGGEDITHKEEGFFGLDEFHDATEAIQEICLRHPLRLTQAKTIEAYFAQRVVDRLIAKGEFKVVVYQNRKFLLPSEFVFDS